MNNQKKDAKLIQTQIDPLVYKTVIKMYFDEGYLEEEIKQATGLTLNTIRRIIDANKEKHEEIRTLLKAHKKEPEVGKLVVYGGKEYYDYTDLFLDRPCICSKNPEPLYDVSISSVLVPPEERKEDDGVDKLLKAIAE